MSPLICSQVPQSLGVGELFGCTKVDHLPLGNSILIRPVVSMKALFYIVCLLLSLPNLMAGLALLVLQHTFATRNPLQIITDFLFGIVWGLLLAAVIFIVLRMAGFFSAVRPYAAVSALVLNAAALVLVLFRISLPRDFSEGIFFLLILVALIGFGWITHRGFALRRVFR